MNPFCTQFTTAIPFVDEGETLSVAIKRFENANGSGQIVGAHGAGKSTLARAIANTASIRNRVGRVQELIFRTGKSWKIDWDEMASQRNDSDQPPSLPAAHFRGLLLLDGIERLNRFQRWALLRHCRWRNIEVLITTHRPLPRIPVVATLQASVAMLQTLVEQLLQSANSQSPASRPKLTITPQQIGAVYDAAGGNLREALMLLYDDYENLRSGVSS